MIMIDMSKREREKENKLSRWQTRERIKHDGIKPEKKAVKDIMVERQ